MDLDGLELAARFSLPPNLRGYCGKQGLLSAFERYISEKSEENEAKLRIQLEKLPLMCAYLETIADANCIPDKFDYRVVEGFWIGNRTIEKVDARGIALLYSKALVARKLFTKKRAAQTLNRIASLPFLPPLHHSFHVYVAEFASQKASKSAANKDACRPSWAKTVKIGGKTIRAEYSPIVFSRRKPVFGKKKKVTLARNVGNVALIGDRAKNVAAHWRVAVKEINAGEQKAMKRYTKLVLSSISK